ncbi:MAG: PKD domain-containing protein [Bacteroidota bacterium]
MKTILRICFCWGLFWSLAAPPTVEASHVLAHDLTWACTPGNSCDIIFTYRVYQDCPDTFAPQGPSFNWTCQNPTNAPSPTANGGWVVQNPGGTDVTPLCPTAPSICSGGTFPGAREYIMTRVYNFCGVSLSGCSQWDFNWLRCCRSNQLTSLNLPQSNRIYSTGTVSFNPINCNNSPVFNNEPVLYICDGQTATFDMGGTDPDGDLLTYTLVNCMHLPGQPVFYRPGYGGASPMGPNWNVTVNGLTGAMTFENLSPDPEVSVVCLRVDEIRNGQTIGSSTREIHVRTINCANNNVPVLSGLDGGSTFDAKACVGVQQCFTIQSDDLDPLDILDIDLVQGLPGLTISVSGGLNPFAIVCWTPTISDVGVNSFVLQVQDNGCPVPASDQFTYTIEVDSCAPCDTVSNDPSFTLTQSLLDVVVTNTTTGYVSFVEFVWGDGSPNELYSGNYTTPVTHTFPAPGTYTVCMNIIAIAEGDKCPRTVCQTITVDDDICQLLFPNWTVNPVFQDPCSYTFTNTTIPAGATYTWNFGDGSPIATGSPITHTYSSDGTYFVILVATYCDPNDPNNCCIRSQSGLVVVNGCKDIKSARQASLTQLAWDEVNASLAVELLPDDNHPQAGEISLFSLEGKQLGTQIATPGENVQFDLSGYAAGIYLVRTFHEGKVETKKFLRP